MTVVGERRRWPRRAPEPPGTGAVRFVGGADGRLVDVSPGGACVRSSQRTAPGRSVVLVWPTWPERGRALARVTRACVARLGGEAGVEYAIGLEYSDTTATAGVSATRAGKPATRA